MRKSNWIPIVLAFLGLASITAQTKTPSYDGRIRVANSRQRLQLIRCR